MSGEIPHSAEYIPPGAIGGLILIAASWVLGKMAAEQTSALSKAIAKDDLIGDARVEAAIALPVVTTGALLVYGLITHEDPVVNIFSLPLTSFLVNYAYTSYRLIAQKVREANSTDGE